MTMPIDPSAAKARPAEGALMPDALPDPGFEPAWPDPATPEFSPAEAARDNARRGTWRMNEDIDGWVLIGANGRPVMRSDGSRVAFRFHHATRLARDDETRPEPGPEPGPDGAAESGVALADLNSGLDDDWQPERIRSYFADLTKAAKLLAYHYVRFTTPEEAVRRAVATLTGNPVHIDEATAKAWIPRKFDARAVQLVANRMRREVVGPEGGERVAEQDGSAIGDAAIAGGPLGQRSEAENIASAYGAAGRRLGPHRPTNEGASLFDYMVDLAKGVAGGARDAAQEALEAIDSLASLDGELSKQLALPNWQTRTEGAAAARSVSQFLVGFLPAFKVIKFASGGVAASRIVKFAQVEGAAAIASATVLDPLEDRLSNTWQELGLPHNILTDYLAADPDDSEAEGRLKSALESLAVGPLLTGGLALSIGILRSARRLMTPKAAISGSAVGTGLILEEDLSVDKSPKDESEVETLETSETDSMLNPLTGGALGAMAFGSSSRSVDPRPIRKAWEIKEGKVWPREENGRRYQLHHKEMLQDDGAKYDLDNIEPMTRHDHTEHHKKNGDYSKGAKAGWARRKAVQANEKSKVGKVAKKVVTRGKLKGK